MIGQYEDGADRFIDMHCHILPGVDDGSKDLAMSLGMAKLAVENHIGTIIVTPHYNSAHRSVSPDGIRRRVEELQQTLNEEGLDLTLYPGNELFYDTTLPDLLSKGKVLTLADSRYCLVEFHPMDDYRYIRDGLRALIYEGFHPILAHCERYECLVKKPPLAEELAEQKILLQCNSASVVQKLFQPVPKFVNSLLRQKLVSFVSTDAHRDSGTRSPDLTGAVAWLRKKYDGAYVQALLAGNAQRVLEGQIV